MNIAGGLIPGGGGGILAKGGRICGELDKGAGGTFFGGSSSSSWQA